MQEPIAELKHVTKRYGEVVALRDFDLQIGPGELLAVLGPNGAGKTTAVRLLLALARPTSGTVELFGKNPHLLAARQRAGAMLQVAKVPDTLRVWEHIDLFSSYYPSPLPMKDVLAAAGLVGLEKRLFGELSGGQKQRVLFALAICGNPDLLFLDEPTVGLDAEARRTLWEHIRGFVAKGGSILLTTHYLEEADALADRIVVLNRGRIIAEGTAAQIKARGAAKKIRFSSELDETALSSIAGVSAITRDKHRFEILTSCPEDVLRDLLARDRTVSELEISASSLEEAFLALTKDDEAAAKPSRDRNGVEVLQ
jgi:ABC-2 type transport system ATP-binding protein